MFDFETISANDLSPEQLATWSTIQQQDLRFESPFFRPEFTQALADVRDDVRVALLLEDGREVGFFPYEQSGGVGRPAGYPMSSFHGVVTQASGWSPEELLTAVGLTTLRFEQWIPDQPELESWTSVRAPCAEIDLRKGFDSYVAKKKRQGSKLYTETRRLGRKLSRELGELSCRRSTAAATLKQLCAWKSSQCDRTGCADLFRFEWSTALLRRLLEQATASVGGVLWELLAGDRLIAANYALRAGRTAQGWFMAFDTQFEHYSPGMILMHEVLRDCEQLGITRFELGKGVNGFKKRLMTDVVKVREGSVDPRPMIRAAWSQWLKTRDWVRNSRLCSAAHRVDRVLTNTRRVFGGQC